MSYINGKYDDSAKSFTLDTSYFDAIANSIKERDYEVAAAMALAIKNTADVAVNHIADSLSALAELNAQASAAQAAAVNNVAVKILEAIEVAKNGDAECAAALAASVANEAAQIMRHIDEKIDDGVKAVNDHGDENTQKVLDAVSSKTGVSRVAVIVITIIAIAFGILSFAVTKSRLTESAEDYKDKYRTGAVSVTQTDDKPSFVEFTVEFDKDGKVGRTIPTVDNGDITMFAACAAGVSVAAVVLAAMAVLGMIKKKGES